MKTSNEFVMHGNTIKCGCVYLIYVDGYTTSLVVKLPGVPPVSIRSFNHLIDVDDCTCESEVGENQLLYKTIKTPDFILRVAVDTVNKDLSFIRYQSKHSDTKFKYEVSKTYGRWFLHMKDSDKLYVQDGDKWKEV